jgi:hypothetical protein
LINNYWENPADPANNQSVIANITLVLFHNIFTVKKFVANMK